ncbi:MAG: tRNA pseudouridine(38-40) synthase TruA [Salinivirgaceae bacterium]|nr:tRNA pseudouridine(38-40) synthase TruA [Salinivirgaceae bacterium]
MSRFKITIEYDGGRYAGWQVQRGEKTIQGAFFDACKKLFGEGKKFEFFGSGRTDAGVHALAQIAHLDVDTTFSTERIRMGLNDGLPYDINVLKVERAPETFHARHDAVERSYVYLISKRRTAFGKSNIWWIKDHLDYNEMRKAALVMRGRHDYASFTDKEAETTSTIVNITGVDLYETEDLIAIHITGSHFLWKMVRRMVGILVEVGRNNITPEDVEKMLEKYSSEPARRTAPASGLYLERVYYKGEPTERGRHIVPQILRLK